MAAADQGGGRVPDLYQLLGVPRGASGGEITRAWRRRAAAEHPDRRPRDAAAPARFRALVDAYRVLGDPARRGQVPEPPLRAGPVWVEVAPGVRYRAGDGGWPW